MCWSIFLGAEIGLGVRIITWTHLENACYKVGKKSIVAYTTGAQTATLAWAHTEAVTGLDAEIRLQNDVMRFEGIL